MQSLILFTLAITAANAPFLTTFIWLKPTSNKTKSIAWSFLEWFCMYAGIIALSIFLESRLGLVQPKNWIFWTITLSVFAVFAFPGFVYRTLWRHKHF